MKPEGKIMLFFSSYCIVFLIFLLKEAFNLKYPLLLSSDYLKSNAVSVTGVVIYSIFFIFSIIAIILFRTNYDFGTIKTKKVLTIKSLSNGSSEIISYLLTMVLPLIGTNTISKIVELNEWGNLVIMVIIIIFVMMIYINSSLLIVNPMLSIIGYSLYKIEYLPENSKISVEGMLLTKNKFDPESLKDDLIVHQIDRGIYYRK